MSLAQAAQRLEGIIGGNVVSSFDRQLLNSLFPNDFEYYLIGFEVVDSSDKVTDRFIMPVLPESISIANQKIVNIKKTSAGITVFQNNTFEPIPIAMEGSFGRKFRLMLGNLKTIQEGEDEPQEFQLKVKTGYGAMKELERIYQKQGQVDSNGSPFRINFYNMAFNQSFVVVFQNLTFSQTQENSTIWKYNLNMTAVAPASIGDFNINPVERLAVDTVNRAINGLVTDARNIVGNSIVDATSGRVDFNIGG